MSDTQPKQQVSANLTTLCRQLEEAAAKTKAAEPVARQKGEQEPVLVIRGK